MGKYLPLMKKVEELEARLDDKVPSEGQLNHLKGRVTRLENLVEKLEEAVDLSTDEED